MAALMSPDLRERRPGQWRWRESNRWGCVCGRLGSPRWPAATLRTSSARRFSEEGNHPLVGRQPQRAVGALDLPGDRRL